MPQTESRRSRHSAYMRERYRHDRDHRENHKAYVRESRRRRRVRVTKLLDEIRSAGCAECGQSPDQAQMHFHHRDPEAKSFEIANWVNHSDDALRIELEKCEVLCFKCHRDKHKAPCGTRGAYRRGCRCDPCRKAQSVYARESRIRRLAKA